MAEDKVDTPEEFAKKLNHMVAKQIAHEDTDGVRIASVTEALCRELGMAIAVIGGGQKDAMAGVTKTVTRHIEVSAKEYAPKGLVARIALHAMKKERERKEKLN